MKKMFLNITDSVMNSHIYLSDVYLKLAHLFNGYFTHLQVIVALSKLHTSCIYVSGVFHLFLRSLEKMFLNITDSVMNSHIF